MSNPSIVPELLSQQPRNILRAIRNGNRFTLTAARGGKSTIIAAQLDALLMTAAEHGRRMRGEYVHRHKGRVQRQYPLRRSLLDSRAFRRAARQCDLES